MSVCSNSTNSGKIRFLFLPDKDELDRMRLRFCNFRTDMVKALYIQPLSASRHKELDTASEKL